MNQLAARDNNQLQAPQRPSDLMDQFLAFIDASKSTTKAYTSNLKRFFSYLQEQGIENPTRSDIISYRDHLYRQGLKNTTIQAYIIAVRMFFRWTGSVGAYPNIADHIKGAKVSRDHKKDYITAEQAKKLIQATADSTTAKRDKALISLMITTGLRTIEISRALVEDMRSLGNQTVLYVQGKGKDDKADFVKISPAVEDLIRSYHKEAGITTGSAPLFQSTSNNSKGQTLSTRSIRGIVKDHLKAIGINSDRISAHSMRHTSVTLALIGGATIQEAQQHARHKSIDTTMIYAHNLEKAGNTCAQVVSDELFT